MPHVTQHSLQQQQQQTPRHIEQSRPQPSRHVNTSDLRTKPRIGDLKDDYQRCDSNFKFSSTRRPSPYSSIESQHSNAVVSPANSNRCLPVNQPNAESRKSSLVDISSLASSPAKSLAISPLKSSGLRVARFTNCSPSLSFGSSTSAGHSSTLYKQDIREVGMLNIMDWYLLVENYSTAFLRSFISNKHEKKT